MLGTRPDRSGGLLFPRPVLRDAPPRSGGISQPLLSFPLHLALSRRLCRGTQHIFPVTPQPSSPAPAPPPPRTSPRCKTRCAPRSARPAPAAPLHQVLAADAARKRLVLHLALHRIGLDLEDGLTRLDQRAGRQESGHLVAGEQRVVERRLPRDAGVIARAPRWRESSPRDSRARAGCGAPDEGCPSVGWCSVFGQRS